MLDCITWIFSGIGTTILSYMWPKKYKSQVRNKVKGNNNIVIGGSIVCGDMSSSQLISNVKVKNEVEGDYNKVVGQNINEQKMSDK